MGDVTSLQLDQLESKLERIEDAIEALEDWKERFYREDYLKLQRVVDHMDRLVTHVEQDMVEHRTLEARILQNDFKILQVQAEISKAVGDLEKKLLRTIAAGGLVAGGAGAGVWKVLAVVLGG